MFHPKHVLSLKMNFKSNVWFIKAVIIIIIIIIIIIKRRRKEDDDEEEKGDE